MRSGSGAANHCENVEEILVHNSYHKKTSESRVALGVLVERHYNRMWLGVKEDSIVGERRGYAEELVNVVVEPGTALERAHKCDMTENSQVGKRPEPCDYQTQL